MEEEDVDDGGGDEDAAKPRSTLAADGCYEWKVERFLATRFGPLPDPAFDKLPPPLTEAEEARREVQRAKRQAALRTALPPTTAPGGRYHIETLEYLVKWKGLGYRHVEWITFGFLRDTGAHWGAQRARRFLEDPAVISALREEEARMAAGDVEVPPESAYFEEDLTVVEKFLGERIVECTPPPPEEGPNAKWITACGAVGLDNMDGHPSEEELEERSLTSPPLEPGNRKRRAILVKWRGMQYGESSWEWEDDLAEEEEAAAQYARFKAPPQDLEAALGHWDATNRCDIRPAPDKWAPFKDSPVFKAGRSLRDYQLEGVNWMVFNWFHRRNCILADEMGLGKTIQTVAVLEHLRLRQGVRGPFLVIAPLSTLGNWKREFDGWTDMNAVYYHDTTAGAASRALIRKYEWAFMGKEGRTARQAGVYRFNSVITSFQTLVSDWEYFQTIRWRYVIVDEAHMLRNKEGQVQQALQAMQYDSLLLLTGTPLQNNTEELWSLLNLLQRDRFGTLHEFFVKYGDLKTPEQVEALQQMLQPVMLRRIKEDVEKSIPRKEETIINVELTRVQKAYYRAVFERNRAFLMRGASTTGPVSSLINIEMELRKCCNHPFLLRNAESRELIGARTPEERLEVLVKSSGKMGVMDKLLPKLQREGHRVLIFSQFKIMLDILGTYLSGRGWKFERLDGGIRGGDRQGAIDRFNKPGSDIFAFLLSTKAGGMGINLTSADTIIIFDSDWNPQNDVQAMARSHRIGQTNTVRIYRLITAKTYEAEMFKRASKKLGLAQAVFEGGGISSRFVKDASGEGEDISGLLTMDRDKVEALLRYGAYAIMEGAEEEEEMSIEDILAASKVVTYDASRAKEAELEGEGASASSSSSSSSSSAAGAARRPGAGGIINLSKAKFASDEGDKALDMEDKSFWEKVLGPKPWETLQVSLNDGILKSTPSEIAQWVADFTCLCDDLFIYNNSLAASEAAHDAAETVQNILIQLEHLGKSISHPLSSSALAALQNSSSGRAGGRGGSAASASSTVPLPPPRTSVIAAVSQEATAAAEKRSKSSVGLCPPPEVDEDSKQNDGNLAAFASWWKEKLTTTSRARKRVRASVGFGGSYALAGENSAGASRSSGKMGRLSGPRRRGHDDEDDEAFEDEEDAYKSKSGAAKKGKGRLSKGGKEAADAAAAEEEGEDDEDEDYETGRGGKKRKVRGGFKKGWSNSKGGKAAGGTGVFVASSAGSSMEEGGGVEHESWGLCAPPATATVGDSSPPVLVLYNKDDGLQREAQGPYPSVSGYRLRLTPLYPSPHLAASVAASAASFWSSSSSASAASSSAAVGIAASASSMADREADPALFSFHGEMYGADIVANTLRLREAAVAARDSLSKARLSAQLKETSVPFDGEGVEAEEAGSGGAACFASPDSGGGVPNPLSRSGGVLSTGLAAAGAARRLQEAEEEFEAAAEAAGWVDGLPQPPPPPTMTYEVQWDLLERTGLTRSQLLTAAGAGITPAEFRHYSEVSVRTGEPVDWAAAAQELAGAPRSEQEASVRADMLIAMHNLALWHMRGRASRSSAIQGSGLPPPTHPGGALPDCTALVCREVRPMRLLGAWSQISGKTLKPDCAKGLRLNAPAFMLKGLKADDPSAQGQSGLKCLEIAVERSKKTFPSTSGVEYSPTPCAICSSTAAISYNLVSLGAECVGGLPSPSPLPRERDLPHPY